MAAWVEHRERVAWRLLAPIVAGQNGGIETEVTGSRDVHPPSDLDITICSTAPEGDVAMVIGEFYEAFRHSFGAESAFLLDLNTLDHVPVLARRGLWRGPDLERVVHDPRVLASTEVVQDRAALARIYRALPSGRWDDYVRSLCEGIAERGDEMAERLEGACRDWTAAQAEILERFGSATSPLGSPTSSENLLQYVLNREYVARLFRVQELYRRQWEVLRQMEGMPEGSERLRLEESARGLEISLSTGQTEARYFTKSSYVSAGAIKHVVGVMQRGGDRAAGLPLLLTPDDYLASANENAGCALQAIAEAREDGLLHAVRWSSKFVDRFLAAGLALVGERPALGARLVRMRAATALARARQKDPRFPRDKAMQAELREAVEEAWATRSVDAYVDALVDLDIELNLVARRNAEKDGPSSRLGARGTSRPPRRPPPRGGDGVARARPRNSTKERTVTSPRKTSRICVLCGGSLRLAAAGDICSSCSTEYPEVGGVGVFVPPAAAFLGATERRLGADRAALEVDLGAEPAPTAVAARAESALAARKQNLDLIEEHCAPVLRHLQGRPAARTLTEAIAAQRGGGQDGWSYFYTDWAATPAFLDVVDLFCRAALRHCQERRSAVVLGSAAGGLVARLSPLFEETLGVDLSMPMLLVSKALLAGGDVCLRLGGDADWTPVELRGDPTAAGEVGLLAADASCLPFPDGSISMVTTQYFLDIVLDLTATVREIHRVLAPDGVWLSYSLPFRVLSDPAIGPRTEPEVEALLSTFGFELLEIERRRHRFRDLTAVAPSTRVIEESVLAFAARKVRPIEADAAAEALRAYYRGQPEAIWQMVPRAPDGRQIQMMSGTQVEGGRRSQRSEFGFSIDVRDVRTLVRSEIPPPVAMFVKALFDAIQRPQTLREIFETLERASGGLLTREDFVGAVRGLKYLGLLELSR